MEMVGSVPVSAGVDAPSLGQGLDLPSLARAAGLLNCGCSKRTLRSDR